MSAPTRSPQPIYCFEGSTYPPEKLVVRVGEKETRYSLKAGTDAEPRGVCLLARPSGSDSSTYDPPSFVLRVPDLGPLPASSRSTYLDQFDREVNEEKKILDHLSRDEFRNLIGGPAEAQRIDVAPYARAGVSNALPALKRNFVKGRSLRECRKGNDVDFKEWFIIAEDLIRTIYGIHLAGTPHGYICPTNVIISEGDSRVTLINFERDLPDPTLHDPTADERVMSWRRPYDSPERRCFNTAVPGSPLPQDPFVPGDLYSLGLTLLWLAVQKSLQPFEGEVPWRGLPWRLITNPLRKSDSRVRDEILELLKPNPDQKDDYEWRMAAVEVIFACLRMEDHRFYNARAILEVLRQCKPVDPVPAVTPRSDPGGVTSPVDGALRGLYAAIDNHPGVGNSLVAVLYRPRLERILLPFIEESQLCRYTAGTRDDVIRALETAFGRMGSAGYRRCRAMTTTSFFSKGNCSPGGRVLSAIQRAIVRGASIEWLLLLNETRMNDPETIAVMRSQLEARKRVGPINEVQWSVNWLPLHVEEYRRFVREHESFLYFSAEPEGDGSRAESPRSVLMVPDYSAEPGKIIALRAFPLGGAVTKDRARRLLDVLDSKFKDGYPLTSFQHTKPI